MTINYYKKEVYGKTLLYIKGSETAELIQRLTGKKTVDNHDLVTLRALGHKIEQVMG